MEARGGGGVGWQALAGWAGSHRVVDTTGHTLDPNKGRGRWSELGGWALCGTVTPQAPPHKGQPQLHDFGGHTRLECPSRPCVVRFPIDWKLAVAFSDLVCVCFLVSKAKVVSVYCVMGCG